MPLSSDVSEANEVSQTTAELIRKLSKIESQISQQLKSNTFYNALQAANLQGISMYAPQGPLRCIFLF